MTDNNCFFYESSVSLLKIKIKCEKNSLSLNKNVCTDDTGFNLIESINNQYLLPPQRCNYGLKDYHCYKTCIV